MRLRYLPTSTFITMSFFLYFCDTRGMFLSPLASDRRTSVFYEREYRENRNEFSVQQQQQQATALRSLMQIFFFHLLEREIGVEHNLCVIVCDSSQRGAFERKTSSLRSSLLSMAIAHLVEVIEFSTLFLWLYVRSLRPF